MLLVANKKNLEILFPKSKYTGAEVAGIARMLEEARNEGPEEIDAVLERMNTFLKGYGVEAVRGDYQVDRYYYDIVAVYVNMGDTYDTTILYETDTGRFYVTSLGGWVEEKGEEYAVQ